MDGTMQVLTEAGDASSLGKDALHSATVLCNARYMRVEYTITRFGSLTDEKLLVCRKLIPYGRIFEEKGW
jgi:hypothetical protein